MSLTTNCGYDYVFELASRLSPVERERLSRELPKGLSPQPEEPQKLVLNDEYIKQHGVPVGDGFVLVTVPGKPVISEAKLEGINRRAVGRPERRAPGEIEANRQKLLGILLNCPVLTDEELKGFEEARKEINECRLAY